MTKTDLKETLASKGIVFINQLKKNLGLDKKGSKAKDIEDILEYSDENMDKVLDALETIQILKNSRMSRLISIFTDIRENWEEIVLFVEQSDNAPEIVKLAVQKIDDVIDFIFK